MNFSLPFFHFRHTMPHKVEAGDEREREGERESKNFYKKGVESKVVYR